MKSTQIQTQYTRYMLLLSFCYKRTKHFKCHYFSQTYSYSFSRIRCTPCLSFCEHNDRGNVLSKSIKSWTCSFNIPSIQLLWHILFKKNNICPILSNLDFRFCHRLWVLILNLSIYKQGRSINMIFKSALNHV